MWWKNNNNPVRQRQFNLSQTCKIITIVYEEERERGKYQCIHYTCQHLTGICHQFWRKTRLLSVTSHMPRCLLLTQTHLEMRLSLWRYLNNLSVQIVFLPAISKDGNMLCVLGSARCHMVTLNAMRKIWLWKPLCVSCKRQMCGSDTAGGMTGMECNRMTRCRSTRCRLK